MIKRGELTRRESQRDEARAVREQSPEAVCLAHDERGNAEAVWRGARMRHKHAVECVVLVRHRYGREYGALTAEPPGYRISLDS
jgi:hypothetical protein